jgi:molybdopterin-synthase adenylyltransferase
VYVRGDEEIHFVYLATRKRLITRAQPYLVQSLSWLDGQYETNVLAERMASRHGPEARGHFLGFLDYLEIKGIVVEREWLAHIGLDLADVSTYERQLAFLLDILGTPDRAAEIQSRISRARLVCFGVGAVGSWLIRLLIGLGFRRFLIVDHDSVSESDVSRHAFFEETSHRLGENKALVLADCLRRLFPDVEIEGDSQPLTTTTDLDRLLTDGVDLVINAADQPYIGYTSVLLSRLCVPRGLPLLVAGGFDAHLASVSEMIVPGLTPCADCYADYFEEALVDWAPIDHPVPDRREAAGGLCSLTVFAAGAAAMEVVRLFTGQGDPRSGRGELLFEDYRLESFSVARREDCPVCSAL